MYRFTVSTHKLLSNQSEIKNWKGLAEEVIQIMSTALVLKYNLYQGFPTKINHVPHTCQSGLKAGRMKQN